MRDRRDEMDAFKLEIDLVAFAESYGFELDPKLSGRTTAAMVNPATGEKMRVSKKPNGHFTFVLGAGGKGSQGSIVDFVQNRTGIYSFGEVRKILRPWIGAGTEHGQQRGLFGVDVLSHERLQAAVRDFEAVAAAWDAMSPITVGNRYLEDERCIPPSTYQHPKFTGRIRVDQRGNVAFPHWDASRRVTGFELKNTGFTGFAKGGAKRLFGSGISEADTELIVCETAIDLLSYAALHGVEGRRFISTAGSFSGEQVPLLKSAIRKLPAGGTVVWAVDADEGGNTLTARFMALFGDVEGHDLSQRRHSPSTMGRDWNDELKARSEANSPPPSEPR